MLLYVCKYLFSCDLCCSFAVYWVAKITWFVPWLQAVRTKLRRDCAMSGWTETDRSCTYHRRQGIPHSEWVGKRNTWRTHCTRRYHTINFVWLTELNRVHIVAQRANRYIVAFHIMISQYCTIFTYQEAAVKRHGREVGTLVYTEVTGMMCGLRMHPLADADPKNPVADWPSDHPCDNYRRVNVVWAVEQCTLETCVGARYCLISGHRDNPKVADSAMISRYRLIDMNSKLNCILWHSPSLHRIACLFVSHITWDVIVWALYKTVLYWP